MTSGSWSWWGSSTTAGAAEFDRIVEKCTSENLPSSTPPSISDSLELSDLLRSSGVPPSYALKSLRRRLTHANPNVSLLAISVLDICVKNGGDAFLREVGHRDFSDEVAGLIRGSGTNREVKDKLKREFQNWALAFEAVPSLRGSELVAQYHRLRHQGIEFPAKDHSATAAMVDSLSAPEWRDSDVCERCRTAFSFTNRKHHCRNCGGVFDNQCSTKRRLLPHFGITGEQVRVCDGCDRLLAMGGGKNVGQQRRNSVAGDWPTSPTSPKANGVSRSSTFSPGRPRSSYHRHALSVPNKSSRISQREEDDIARAIALSLQEAGSSSSPRPGYTPGYVDGPSRPPDPPVHTWPENKGRDKEEEYDADLAAAIAASLREVEAPKPSAPVSAGDSKVPPKRPPLPSYDLSPAEENSLLSFASDLESAQTSGRLNPHDRTAVARFDAMHDRALSARQQLLRGLGDADRKTQLLQEMNDKVSQAVKMYDRLLEEQLAHRTQSPAYGVQPAHSLYSKFASPAPVASSQPSYPQQYPTASQPYSTAPYPPQTPHLSHPAAPSHYPTSPQSSQAQFVQSGPAVYSSASTQPQVAADHTAAPSLYASQGPQYAPQPPQGYPDASPHRQSTYSPVPAPPMQYQHFAEHPQPSYGHEAPLLHQQAPQQPAEAPLQAPPQPQQEEPSYYKTPYVHYTADSFPTAPQTEPHQQPIIAAAGENPWAMASGQTQGYGSLERREEAAPLIEL